MLEVCLHGGENSFPTRLGAPLSFVPDERTCYLSSLLRCPRFPSNFFFGFSVPFTNGSMKPGTGHSGTLHRGLNRPCDANSLHGICRDSIASRREQYFRSMVGGQDANRSIFPRRLRFINPAVSQSENRLQGYGIGFSWIPWEGRPANRARLPKGDAGVPHVCLSIPDCGQYP